MGRRSERVCDCNLIHEHVVMDVQKQLEDFYLHEEMVEFFKVLGDYTRLKIVVALDKSEMCVCDLAYLLNSTKSAVSHQLKVLEQNNIIRRRRSGKNVFYSLDDGHVKEVVEIAIEHLTHTHSHVN